MNRTALTTVGVIVLLAIAGAAGWWFLTDNTEISTNIEDTAEQLEAESASDIVFTIDAEQSQAVFEIDEVLRGEDVTVVGTTNQVGGDIRVNVANPAASEIGTITINARALETDVSNRNRALRQFILRSSEDEYEFINFEVTALENMPESVSVGETFEFQITGELTIVDTTNTVTFDATVTPTSETEITGSATTIVDYNDFNLTIPEVPFVASVEDNVTLRLEFVAVAGEAEGDEDPA
jgi:polyisoprenoid-binding protein YceI